MATIRERCKHCGTLLQWQEDGHGGHVLVTPRRDGFWVMTTPRVCPVRSLAPHAPSPNCEMETRADRMAQDNAKRLARKFGTRTKGARTNGRR